jgi:hypothetical protein
MNTIFLPRQARDKHRESTQKRLPFSQVMKHSVINDTLSIVCPPSATVGGSGPGMHYQKGKGTGHLGGFSVLYDEAATADGDEAGGGEEGAGTAAASGGGGGGGGGGGASLGSAAALRRAAAAARGGVGRRGSSSDTGSGRATARPGSARPRVASAGPGGRGGSPRVGSAPGRKKDTI